MNPEEDSETKEERKQILKEKKELKMLERFMYDPKEKALRESTRKIIHQENYYTDLIKGQSKVMEEESSLLNRKGKKRGRKPKKKIIPYEEEEKSVKSSKKKGKKSEFSDNKSLSGGRIIKMSNVPIEDVEMNVVEAQSVISMNICIGNATSNGNGNGISFNNNNHNESNGSYLSDSEGTSLHGLQNSRKNLIALDLTNSSIFNKEENLNNNPNNPANSNNPQKSNNNNNNNVTKSNSSSYIFNESEVMREKVEQEYPREVEKYQEVNNNANTNTNGFNLENGDNNNYLDNNPIHNHINLTSKTFINCDLRFFNFDLITSRIGFFDVIMIDPPWRIKGGQRNDSSFMFSNSKFNLEYNTLSNNEIVSLPVEKLSQKGFCFLWILNSLMNVGYECLNKWGYDVVDQITWVKTRNEKLYISQGYYFLHSSETCIVGYKCPPNERVEYKSKTASNIMFGSVRGKSQKPEEIYELIEKMMPGSKKVELFARNNNLREGWLSLGNQLGENYQSWRNVISCDNCTRNIDLGIKRYKSKLIPNYDICQKCYEKNFTRAETSQISQTSQNNCDNKSLNNHKAENFFEFKNNIDEDILHQYYSCNDCNSEPIWGNRFHCSTCENFDLCEACFDKEILNESHKENPHVLAHDFKCFEVPELANGMNTHNDYRCKFCFQKPIIGPCFECIDCKNYTICQSCYFNSSFVDDKHFSLNSEHKFTIQIKTKNKLSKYVKCFGCAKEPIEKIRFKCNNCFDFNLCEICYRDRLTKEFLASSHKNYHSFTAFYL